MNTRRLSIAAAVAAVVGAGCAGLATGNYGERAFAMMKSSFKENGQAKLDRLDQDDTQRLCSEANADHRPLAAAERERIEKSNMARIKWPADGKLLGDWRAGERIAQSGVGKQFNDAPTAPAGGNCYACHQLSGEELAYGTIGPSLRQFAKVRANTSRADLERYVYGKVYNAQAYSACSNMPRFGANGILTEQQIKDVTALVLDANSPVNK